MVSASNVAGPGKVAIKSGPSAFRQALAQVPLKKILRTKVIVRLLGICVSGCLTGYLLFESSYWMAGVWTGVATAVLFYETVRFVDHSERKLAAFLQALSQHDFSVLFHENGKAHYDLHGAFNRLNETFRRLRSDRESQHQLLQVVVETAAVPMICFEEGSENVYLVNQAAKRLFSIPFLRTVKGLYRVDASLPAFVRSIADGSKQSLRLFLDNKQVFLSVTSRHILFQDRNLKLVAFHDVSSELAGREAESWQKLLRVLTHEISNSAIPLSTLSGVIYDRVRQAESEGRELTREERQDVMMSLKTIEQRSKSLKEFVGNFRSVNQVPDPTLQTISVKSIIHDVHMLFAGEAEKQNIHFVIPPMDDTFTMLADRNLTMQVLINLVKNAMEAMENMKQKKTITFSAERMGRYMNLWVCDTGCGIAQEDLDQIFIPFYSTKAGGSGIGLSISQQVMQKQKGDIAVRSVPGKGTQFILTFSC